MAAGQTSAEKESDREIVIQRLLQAPRELVYEAYTDPRHLGDWWGPRGFTISTKSVDIRQGGRWVFTIASHGSFNGSFSSLRGCRAGTICRKHARV